MTEEVTNGNGKLKLENRLTSVEKDIYYMKGNMRDIKKQVSNDIPHQIKAVDNKVDTLSSSFNKFQVKNEKWLNRILVAVMLMLIGTIINFIK